MLLPELKLSLVSGVLSPINFIEKCKSFLIFFLKAKLCFIELTQDIRSLKCSYVQCCGGVRESSAFHSSVGLDCLPDKPVMKRMSQEDGNLQFAQEREWRC